MEKPRLVVLSGAGISAESGIKTFRDSNGLWEGYNVQEVASPEGWAKNPELVLYFYNERRKQVLSTLPNAGHTSLVDLEEKFNVTIITQNVDNLHERAGSSSVVHLHGQLLRSQSSVNPKLIYDIIGSELNIGDLAEDNSQLRPNIVWFGESVPLFEEAVKHVIVADYLIVVGTSLNVYPAAQLMDYINEDSSVYVVDPNMPYIKPREKLTLIEDKATTGLQTVKNLLLG